MGQVHLAETVEVENDGKHVGIPIKEILLRVTVPENRVGAQVGKQRVRMTSQRVVVRLEVLASHVQRDALPYIDSSQEDTHGYKSQRVHRLAQLHWDIGRDRPLYGQEQEPRRWSGRQDFLGGITDRRRRRAAVGYH